MTKRLRWRTIGGWTYCGGIGTAALLETVECDRIHEPPQIVWHPCGNLKSGSNPYYCDHYGKQQTP